MRQRGRRSGQRERGSALTCGARMRGREDGRGAGVRPVLPPNCIEFSLVLSAAPVIIFLPSWLMEGPGDSMHCVEVCLDLSAFDLLMTWAYVHGETACNYFKLQQNERFTLNVS